MIPITVHVPERRVEEFYVRFAEFLMERPANDGPVILESGAVPAWVLADDAVSIATKFWRALSMPAARLLHYIAIDAASETAVYTAAEFADRVGLSGKASTVAGFLGGAGRAARRVGLPLYRTPKGSEWHYLWSWDGEHYSMTPEVAKVLRAAEAKARVLSDLDDDRP